MQSTSYKLRALLGRLFSKPGYEKIVRSVGGGVSNARPAKDRKARRRDSSIVNKAGRVVLRCEFNGIPAKIYEAANDQHARFIRMVSSHGSLSDCFPQIFDTRGRFVVANWTANVAVGHPPLQVMVELQRRLHTVPVTGLPDPGFDYWHDFIRRRFVRAAELLEEGETAQEVATTVDRVWAGRKHLIHPDLTPTNLVQDEAGRWHIIDNELLSLGGMPLLDVCNTAFALGVRQGQEFARLYFANNTAPPEQQVTEIIAAWLARQVGSAFVAGDLAAASRFFREYKDGAYHLPF
jgi:hypothetical protein